MAINTKKEISDDVWRAAKEFYISGMADSGREVCRKYGIPQSQFYKHRDAENWEELRAQNAKNANRPRLGDVVGSDLGEIGQICYETALKLIEKVKTAVDKLPEDDIAGMRQCSTILKDYREMGLYRAALDKKEQQARIKKLEKEAEQEQQDTTVTVVFEEGDAYAD